MSDSKLPLDLKGNQKLKQLSDKYGASVSVRALVQMIPYVGGALDLVLSEQGQKFRQQRIEDYIGTVAGRVEKVEKGFHQLITDYPEQVFDLLRTHLEECDKTRDAERRSYFANILLNQAERHADWSEPETATRLLRSLTGLHISVLREICNAPVCAEPFEGLRVTLIEPMTEKKKEKEKAQNFLILTERFAHVPPTQLRLVVIELVSSGLVKDEGVGRFGATAMEKFSPLPTGAWLLDWISARV